MIEKNSIIRVEESQAYPVAKQRFIESCGFHLEKPKHQKMMKMGEAVRESGVEGIDIRSVVSFYGAECFEEDALHLDGETVASHFFAQIPKDKVVGAYLYALTAGECYFSSEENIMDFLYADIWGTNYTDAGMGLLQATIRKDMEERFGDCSTYQLSPEFGPGYFGMPVSEACKIGTVLDLGKIGVTIRDTGLLIPQKSCSGLFLVTKGHEISAEPGCVSCRGNKGGCQFCNVRPK